MHSFLAFFLYIQISLSIPYIFLYVVPSVLLSLCTSSSHSLILNKVRCSVPYMLLYCFPSALIFPMSVFILCFIYLQLSALHSYLMFTFCLNVLLHLILSFYTDFLPHFILISILFPFFMYYLFPYAFFVNVSLHLLLPFYTNFLFPS